MLAIASLIFAVVPMGLYLWLVWLMDRYDREPFGLVALNFLWGAIGAIILSIVFSVLLTGSLGAGEFVSTVAVAPLVEESMKGVFLLGMARSRHFDNITDGVVYGIAIGLGFGMTENFLYFLGASSPEEWVFLVVIRSLFSAVMHAMATGIFGAFVGLTKFNLRRQTWLLRPVGLMLAMLMHFFWNFSVSINDPAMAGIGLVFIAFSLLLILVLFQVSLRVEQNNMKRQLAEECALGLIPEDHLRFIPYTGRRKMIGWLPAFVDRSEYIRTATRLAFRKSQLPFCVDAQREQFSAEIGQLRQRIATLLGKETTIPSHADIPPSSPIIE
jgi:protease PrsW